MPPATIASAITSTRKTLRTDHSMRRPSMSVPLVAGGGGRRLLRGGGHGVTSVRISGLFTLTCMRVGVAVTVTVVWILSGARGRPVSCVTLPSRGNATWASLCEEKRVLGSFDFVGEGMIINKRK